MNTSSTTVPPPQRVIIHGAGGAIGTAVAEEFARHGAQLFLAGRRIAALEATSDPLCKLGASRVEVAEVDAYDDAAVTAHAQAVVADAGGIDVMINAAGIPLVQGVPLMDMRVEDVLDPAAAWLRTQFITSRAAGRCMVEQGHGTVITLSASPARASLAGVGGFAAACAAIEALTRTMAAEIGRSGVRVVCIRPQRIRETLGSIPDLPMPIDEFVAYLESLTTSGSLPSLIDVARTVVQLAEGGARCMNGAVLNLTCGMTVD